VLNGAAQTLHARGIGCLRHRLLRIASKPRSANGGTHSTRAAPIVHTTVNHRRLSSRDAIEFESKVGAHDAIIAL